jgi:[methyl-Co(III) methanol-specific corrinoid protein]:coenzyme M methyltransferase
MLSHTMRPRERFLAGLHRQPVDRPAVGTLTSLANIEAMQASGARFPEVHLDAELMARLAAFISVETGFDMIFPVFSVVQEAAALGAPIHWGALDAMPSIVTPPWHNAADIRVPADFEEHPALAVVLRALSLLRRDYGDRYAIIGKVFGPWSLGFHMFGVEAILMMTLDDPEGLHEIFQRLTAVTIRCAQAQVAAGADVLCMADHCSRNMCSPETYRTFLAPLHREITARVACPMLLHACGDTSDRILDFAGVGLRGFHYDTVVPAAVARAAAGDDFTLMGGVSNIHGLLLGDAERIRADVRNAVAAGIDIIGPECAIPLTTSLNSLALIRETLEIGGTD